MHPMTIVNGIFFLRGVIFWFKIRNISTLKHRVITTYLLFEYVTLCYKYEYVCKVWGRKREILNIQEWRKRWDRKGKKGWKKKNWGRRGGERKCRKEWRGEKVEKGGGGVAKEKVGEGAKKEKVEEGVKKESLGNWWKRGEKRKMEVGVKKEKMEEGVEREKVEIGEEKVIIKIHKFVKQNQKVGRNPMM